MLKLENVTKYYGNFLAVDNLSFEIKPGEIFGLLGVNGAGKTTTFRMIMGLLTPTAGTITLNGKPIDYSVTDQIGFLTEERSLLTKMTVREQALFYGTLKSMKEDDIIARLEVLLKRFHVEEYMDKKIKELSKGNQQKIQFITAILHKPKLLILDEPFSGLDPFNVSLFKEMVLELKEQGSMIIFSTHRMEHVEEFCEKLVILKQGKTLVKGYLSDIKKDFGTKNIIITGDVSKEKLSAMKGVKEVMEQANATIVKITSEQAIEPIFQYVGTCKNVTKFEVAEPTLNEIFITLSGENYEEKNEILD